ncbi:hypothetical protein TSUD_33300 [Trifolium subterraneum]|uniref:Uncharacterized protein n=1 Tax=Trifolium subterraneum TaxID=3900 RepID=A0A2Z6LTC9_TRISU|nr:hypothetical protein TSUD_33300 [Trifolium subterraneum]
MSYSRIPVNLEITFYRCLLGKGHSPIGGPRPEGIVIVLIWQCSPGWIPRGSSLPLRVFSVLGKVIRYTTVMDTILRLFNVAPSQFHPNSWAFVKGYELLCYALDLEPSLEPSLGVFFSFYHVKSLTPGKLVSVCAQPNKGLFKLFASNFKNYQDSFFRVRYGPGLPSLMYDTDGDRLFPFYWTEDPRAIKGVYDDVLTSFEKETIAFLESFNLIDIKDLLRRETNVKRLTNFIRRMKTVFDEEWMSFLAKSKAKKLQPDDIALPDNLLVPSGGRALRSHSTDVIQTEDVQMGEFVVDGGVTVQAAGPPPIVAGIGSSVWGSTFDPAAFVESNLLGTGDSARFDSLTTSELRNLALSYEAAGPPPIVAGIGSSVWGSTFDPAAFVESNLLGTGDSARFDSLTTSELRNLALSYEVKGTVLTHHSLPVGTKKFWRQTLRSPARNKLLPMLRGRGAHGREIAGLRKKHADEKASLRTKTAILEAEVTTLEVLRNNLIVSLTQSRKDISELEEDVDELEETNTALKQSMADKYVDGFWSSIEQVKILFPELDPDVLAQVDVLKRIKDGKLI